MQEKYPSRTRYWSWLCTILLLIVFCWGGEADAAQSYQVRAGDTLWSLAQKWGVQVEAIQEANKLSGNNLKIGQKLLIPGKSAKADSTKKKVSRGGYRNVVSIAQNFLGVPYVSASSNPRIGFDCSGFTQYAYSLAGVRLPRSSYEQYNVGVSVSRSDLVSGDLVFFNTGGGISHVGIYVGGGSFIHSSSSRGVTITSLSASYWAPRYVGARRVVN